MRTLVAELAEAPYRFIVSKGPQASEFELAPNMVGAEFLPQTSVLPQVDLVITHGGNNTVTESLFFGKPMVLLPIFWDQHDNAQRLDETGFGIRVDTYAHDPADLRAAIARLLDDGALADRLAQTSRRLQSARGTELAATLIERAALPPSLSVTLPQHSWAHNCVFVRATCACFRPSVASMPWPPQVGELLPRCDEPEGIENKLSEYSLVPTTRWRPEGQGLLGHARHRSASIDYLAAEMRRGIAHTPISKVDQRKRAPRLYGSISNSWDRTLQSSCGLGSGPDGTWTNLELAHALATASADEEGNGR